MPGLAAGDRLTLLTWLHEARRDLLQVHPRDDLNALVVAQHVLVKDHFEYGPYSRAMLRLMDFVGNWGYGISVPERYFRRAEFVRLAGEQRLVITALDCGLELYDHLPLVGSLLRPRWQFIAVLSSD